MRRVEFTEPAHLAEAEPGDILVDATEEFWRLSERREWQTFGSNSMWPQSVQDVMVLPARRVVALDLSKYERLILGGEAARLADIQEDPRYWYRNPRVRADVQARWRWIIERLFDGAEPIEHDDDAFEYAHEPVGAERAYTTLKCACLGLCQSDPAACPVRHDAQPKAGP